MKISRIEVNNFRSIQHYNLECADYNVFVGQNNHGKTNLFEALSWFDSGKASASDYHNHNQELEIMVRIYYIEVQSSLENLDNEKIKSTLKNKIGDIDEIIVEKTGSDNKRTLIVNGENIGNPQGFDSALNYFLPKIEYITTQYRLGDVSGYKSKSPIAEMLSGVLTDIVENDPRYVQFIDLFNELFHGPGSIFRLEVENLESKVETYLKKQFAEGAKVDFKITDPILADMLKGFETYVDDGIRTKAEEKGDGMKRAIMLAIIQAYADYRIEKNIARNFIFLIDEAELHLHPAAQRQLKNALREIISQGGQVFINSHSSVFANEEFENQKIFQVSKSTGNSMISHISTEQERMETIYGLLGGSPNDLLLPRNFIIVEGQSECRFLQIIMDRFYKEKTKNIKVIFACGSAAEQAKVFHRIHQLYTPLHTNGVYKDKPIFIFDKPNKDDMQKQLDVFKKTYNWLIDGEHLNMLPENSLEEYYPNPWKRKPGETDYKDKVGLAELVASEIDQKVFEEQMPVLFESIKWACTKAYN